MSITGTCGTCPSFRSSAREAHPDAHDAKFRQRTIRVRVGPTPLVIRTDEDVRSEQIGVVKPGQMMVRSTLHARTHACIGVVKPGQMMVRMIDMQVCNRHVYYGQMMERVMVRSTLHGEMHACMRTCMRTCMDAYVHAYVYKCAHVRTCTCAHAHVYIHLRGCADGAGGEGG